MILSHAIAYATLRKVNFRCVAVHATVPIRAITAMQTITRHIVCNIHTLYTA